MALILVLNKISLKIIELFFDKDWKFPLIFLCKIFSCFKVLMFFKKLFLFSSFLKKFFHCQSTFRNFLLPFCIQVRVKLMKIVTPFINLFWRYSLAIIISNCRSLFFSSKRAKYIPKLWVSFNSLCVLVN